MFVRKYASHRNNYGLFTVLEAIDLKFAQKNLVIPEGLEPSTYCLEGIRLWISETAAITVKCLKVLSY